MNIARDGDAVYVSALLEPRHPGPAGRSDEKPRD
jgi:hypothetical protein